MNMWQKQNKPVIQEFRANGGKAPLILLTTIGAKTGQSRTIPLMYIPYGNAVLAVASKGGSVNHPDWYYNILAHPEVTVEVGNETFKTTARLLHGSEREQAFGKAVEVFPLYATYQQKTPRDIPVFVLERPTREQGQTSL